MSFAKFEASSLRELAAAGGDEDAEAAAEGDDEATEDAVASRDAAARSVYERAYRTLRDEQPDAKEEAVMLLEAWRAFEREAASRQGDGGSTTAVEAVEKRMPRAHQAQAPHRHGRRPRGRHGGVLRLHIPRGGQQRSQPQGPPPPPPYCRFQACLFRGQGALMLFCAIGSILISVLCCLADPGGCLQMEEAEDHRRVAAAGPSKQADFSHQLVPLGLSVQCPSIINVRRHQCQAAAKHNCNKSMPNPMTRSSACPISSEPSFPCMIATVMELTTHEGGTTHDGLRLLRHCHAPPPYCDAIIPRGQDPRP